MTPALSHRRVWSLALPVMLANMTEPLVGIADRAVAGRLGSVAHSAALEVAATTFLVYAWIFGFLRLSTGGLSAQAYGARNPTEGRAVAQRSLLLALVLASLIFLTQRPSLALAQYFFLVSEPAQAELTATFYRIRMLSIWGSLLNFVILGWLVGVQAIGRLVLVQALINVTNILLNITLAFYLGLGIAGIAWASVIATYLGTLMGLFYLWRLGALGRIAPQLLWQFNRFLHLLKANSNLLLRTFMLEAAFLLILRQGAAFGPELLTVNGYILRFHELMAFALDGFAMAVETLAGAAMGAASLAAFRRAVRLTTLWAFVMAWVWVAVYASAGGYLISLFTDQQVLRELAGDYLIWAIIAPILSVWSFQLDGIYFGTTQTAAMRNAMFYALGIFVLALWLLVPSWGNQGLWAAYSLFMLARAATLLIYYPAVERAVALGTPRDG